MGERKYIQASFVKDDGTLFIIIKFIFFQDTLLFWQCQGVDGKGIVPYLLPKLCRPYFS